MGTALSVLDEFREVEPATRLSDVKLRPGAGGGTLVLSFSLMGGLRDVFGPETWERAYSGNDMMLTIRYSVEIVRRGFVDKRIAGPLRFQKEARLYWSRDPMKPNRIWVLAVDEDERTYMPATPEEARQLIFDFEREIGTTGLPRGRNEVWAGVDVSWGRHLYTEKGARRGRSATTFVEVP
ncbi:MAG: hypothetical protein RXP97_03420 [Nitrososphaeria archaeon]